MPSYKLTKSKFIRGLQCHKALYLDVFHKELAVIDEATRLKFAEGRAFEKSFKDSFPNSIDISQRLGFRMSQYPILTAQLLSQPGPIVLFEAGFLFNEVLVLADVVVKDEQGNITVFEVKNADQVKQVFVNDIAIQQYVISHSISHLKHFFLLHNDGHDGFVQVDVSDRMQLNDERIEDLILEMKQTLSGPEPLILPGDHCSNPYPCPYFDHCHRPPQGQQSLPLN